MIPQGYEQEGIYDDLKQVTYASMEQAKATVAGAEYGARNLAASTVLGAQRLISDVGKLIPSNPLPNLHPFTAVRHGLYAHEMSLGGDMAAMFGRGIPETTTAYEFQELAARDFGQRTTNAIAATGMYGAGMIGGTVLGGKMLTSGVKAGFSAGKAMATARGAGMIGKGLMAGGGAIAGALPGVAAYMAMDMTVGKIMDDVADRQDVMNFLEASSFRYIQGQGADVDERFGAGFNRSAQARIAESIKKIDLQDPRFNMEDLKGILEKGTELGMFGGTRDAQDFSQKFKDLTTNLKQVTKILHQSLNDGMETLKSLKEIGITGTTNVSAAIQHADVLGTATGRTAAEMLSIGRQGAEMVRGTGVSMGTGASMMQQTFAMMGAAADSGALSGELVAQGGGVGALSQKVMARHLQNLNTNFGKGAMLSVLGAGGEVDVNKLDALASGEMSLGQIYRGASRNISTPGAYVDAVINRDKNLRTVTEQYGGMGGAMVSMGMEISKARELSRATGRSVRDTAKFLALKSGESEAEFEARFAILDNVEKYEREQGTALDISMRKARGESLREMTNFGAILGDKLDRLINPVSTYVGRKIDAVSENITDVYRSAADTITEKITGVRTARTQAISGSDLADIFIGGKIDVEADPTRRLLETYNFSEGELTKFEAESRKFKEMDKDFLDRSRSTNMLRAASRGVGGFAEAVFGKNYDALTRDEKMFLEAKSRQFAPKLAEELKTRRLESKKQMRDLYATRLQESQVNTEERREALSDARENLLDDMLDGSAKDLMEDIYDEADKDPQAAKNLDTLVISLSNESRYKSTLEDELKKPAGERDERRIEQLRGKLEDAQKKRVEARMSLGKKIKDPERLVAVEDSLGLLANMGALQGQAANLFGARRSLDEALKGDMSVQLEESLKNRFSLIGRKAKESLIGKGASEQRESLQRLLGSIQRGEELSTDDAEELGDIAKLAKSSELASIAGTVMDIKAAERKGQISDVDKLEKFMTERNMLPKDVLDNPKKKTALLNKFFEDNKVQSEKLIQWEVLSKKADRQEGTVFSGGRTNERILESEITTMEGLSKVQQDTVNVINKLKVLSMQLDRRLNAK